MDLVTAEIVANITATNVVEETFSGSPLYAPFPTGSHPISDNQESPSTVIDRGVEIICSPENRDDPVIQSQLRWVLEEAATGARSDDLSAFSAYFDQLL